MYININLKERDKFEKNKFFSKEKLLTLEADLLFLFETIIPINFIGTN